MVHICQVDQRWKNGERDHWHDPVQQVRVGAAGIHRRLTLHNLLHEQGIGVGRMPSEPERAVRG